MDTTFIDETLYHLEQQYGTRLTFQAIVKNDNNHRTGERVIQKVTFRAKAVQLPESIARKFFQDIAFLAANKNFTYGGVDDFGSIIWVIRRRNLPKDFAFDLQYEIADKHQRFNQVKITELAGQVAYIINAKRVLGAPSYQIIEITARQSLVLQQQVGVEVIN